MVKKPQRGDIVDVSFVEVSKVVKFIEKGSRVGVVVTRTFGEEEIGHYSMGVKFPFC